MRHERRFAYPFLTENQDVFALCVQPLQQCDFPDATDKWQRDVHGSHGIHRFVISQNTSSIAQQAGKLQFAKAYRNRPQKCFRSGCSAGINDNGSAMAVAITSAERQMKKSSWAIVGSSWVVIICPVEKQTYCGQFPGPP